MTAAEIVASVRSNPPGGDVAVSPAVRVLVEEIVKLRGELATTRAATEALYQNLVAQCKRAETEAASLRAQLKPLGELSEADHNQLRERAERAESEIVRLRGELANRGAAHPLTVDVTTGMARFITQEDIHRFDVNYERIRAELEHLRHRERVCDSECGPIQAIAHAWYRAEEEFYLPDEDPYAAIVRLREELEIARADIKD